jgi:opacity protein-like surface antigen
MNNKLYLLLFPLSLLSPGAASAAWTGNLNAFVGGKLLDADEWHANEQAEIGATLDFKRADWPVSIAADVHFSQGDFSGFGTISPGGSGFLQEDVHTSDFNLGLRKYWDGGSNMHPYLGAGVAYGQLEVDQRLNGVQTLSDRGDGVGVWAGVGLLWSIHAFNVGVDVRYSQIKVGLDAKDVESGGAHGGVLIGYHW